MYLNSKEYTVPRKHRQYIIHVNSNEKNERKSFSVKAFLNLAV